MKKLLPLAVLLTMIYAVPARAGVNVDVNIGVPVAPQVVIDTTPRFIFSPALGFYVSVGIPYDIVYFDHVYYLHNGDYWYSSHYYNGPWVIIRHQHVPMWLRKHRIQQIRHYRDMEYQHYERDRKHYRGRWYHPARERREHERIEQRKWEHREDRRIERRQQYREDRRIERRQDRREDRRQDRREDRRQDRREEQRHDRGQNR